MNIVRISRLLPRSILLVSLLGLLTACGGGGSSHSTGSSSSSSSSVHIFIPTPITESGSGIWPEIKVSAIHTKVLSFEWSSSTGATFYKLLKKVDVDSAYVQVGSDIAATSATTYSASDAVSVHLTDWVNSRYKVQACIDATTCTDSIEVVTNSAMLSAITYLKASNAQENDWFGWSVALSGDGQTLAIGAPAEDSSATGINQDQNNNDSPNSGAVYVFTKVNGAWQQQAYLKASNTEQPNTNPYVTLPNDRFGYQVAISNDGNTLAVSAMMEDSPSRGIDCSQTDYEYTFSSSSSVISAHTSLNVGAVYIFKRVVNDWSQTTYIKPHNPALNEYFGAALSLSGDGKSLAVGTLSESTYAAGINDVRSSSSAECLTFSSSSSSSSSRSSSSSSSLVGGINSGAVYIFKELDSGWIEEAFIKASDAEANDYFGGSVSLSTDGNTLAVGAVGEDSNSASSNGTIVIKGTTYQLNNGGVYIFTHANDAWSQQAKLKPYENGINLEFGYSVALSGDGNTLAVGTPGDWSTSDGIEEIVGGVGKLGLGTHYDLESDTVTYATGAVYLFAKSADTWTATTYIKASNPNPAYQFGNSVSLSSNGQILAVGSIGESSQATGINGDQLDMAATESGAAYIFTNIDNLWAQKSYVKAPNTEKNDRFGNSLKLDDSGDTLVVGAHRESSTAKGVNGSPSTDPADSATASGAVYIY